jgi:hypothetical protein
LHENAKGPPESPREGIPLFVALWLLNKDEEGRPKLVNHSRQPPSSCNSTAPSRQAALASFTLSLSISLSLSYSSRLPRYSTLRETLLDLSRNKQAYSALLPSPQRDLRPVIRVKTQNCRATFEDIAPLVIRRKIEPVGLKRVLNSKLNAL